MADKLVNIIVGAFTYFADSEFESHVYAVQREYGHRK
mgnify:CR=1 FL=1